MQINFIIHFLHTDQFIQILCFGALFDGRSMVKTVNTIMAKALYSI